MKSVLQKNIPFLLAKKHLSVNALEKRAGLKPSAIQNILHGRSKKPSIQSIYAIANVLECRVEDLLREDLETGETKVAASSETPWDFELYMDCVQTVQNIFKKYKVEAYKEKILLYVDEIYAYSLRKPQKTADKAFAEWCIENWLLKKKPQPF